MRRWAGGALFMLILVVATELVPVFAAESPKPRRPTKLDAEMLLELDVLSDERFGEPDDRGRSEDDEWSELEEPDETDE